ncbi:MAG TPA: hypothetical protein VGN16_09435 [Acidobacteriaceae bacterium]|jgi:hypothetical protein
MPNSAAAFLADTAPAKTAAPSAPGGKQSAASFLQDVAPPAAAPKADKGFNLGDAAIGTLDAGMDKFTGSMTGAFHQLKDDWIKSQGALGSPEALKKWGQSGLWDRLKQGFDAQVAAGKVPLDAFNLVISPLTGALRAGIAGPVAAGVHKALPGSKEMEQQGKLPSAEEGVMEGLSLAMPEKGPGGAAIPPVAGPKKPQSTFAHIVSRPFQTPEEFAQGYAKRALNKGGVTKEAAVEKVSKPGQTISDLGDTAMVQAGEQAAMSGEGRRLGAALHFDDRLKGRRARVAEAVNSMVTDKNMYEFLGELDQNRKTHAGPLYKEAWKGGSTAPLKSHLEGDYATNTEAHMAAVKRAMELDQDKPHPAVEAATKEAKEAEAALQRAKDRVNFAQKATWDHAGTTVNEGAWKAREEAQAKHDSAQEHLKVVTESSMRRLAEDRAAAKKAVEDAHTKRMTSLERMQQAQNDELEGKKGGLWSPRLQQFLDDDIMKPGISRGLEIQRLEALKDGEPFDPKEFAITGEKDGEPVVGKVPNLRLLDAAKRGLDAMIADERHPQTHELSQRGGAIEGVRKEFVKHLDELTADNPAYKAARAAWAGPSQVMDSVREGMKFAKQAPEEIKKAMAGLSEHEKEGRKIGVARYIADEVSDPAGALRMAKKIVNDDYFQRQLKAELGEEMFANMHEMAEREVEWQERGSQVMGGSQTARRNEAGKEFEEIAPILDDMITSARHGMTGIAASGTRQVSRVVTSWIGNKIQGLSQARRDALAKLLFSTDKEDNLRALELLYDEGHVSAPSYPKSKTFMPLAAAAGADQQQDQQQ